VERVLDVPMDEYEQGLLQKSADALRHAVATVRADV
jgi:hypothetical protein